MRGASYWIKSWIMALIRRDIGLVMKTIINENFDEYMIQTLPIEHVNTTPFSI